MRLADNPHVILAKCEGNLCIITSEHEANSDPHMDLLRHEVTQHVHNSKHEVTPQSCLPCASCEIIRQPHIQSFDQEAKKEPRVDLPKHWLNLV